MRIASFTSLYLPSIGGLQLNVNAAARALARMGHEVRVCAFRGGRPSPISLLAGEYSVGAGPEAATHVFEDSELSSVNALPLPMRIVVRALLSLWRIARFTRSRRPDVAHVHFASEHALYAIGICRILHIPVVLFVRGSDILGDSHGASRLLRRLCLRWADQVVALSQALADCAQRLEPLIAGRISVICNGVDDSLVLRARGADATDVPERFVLCLSNLERVKGVDIAIRAYAESTGPRSGWYLVIAGEGSQRDLLLQLARDLRVEGQVYFWGRATRDDVAGLLEACSVLVLPSRSEGFGTVLLEAGLFGKPVVATRVGGPAELVEDGVTGLLVPPEDSPAMARALSQLMESPAERTRLGCAGRQRVHRFSWDRVVEEYLTVSERAMKRPASGM